MHAIDILVQNYFVSIRTPAVTEFLYLVTVFFDGTFYFVLLMICVAFLIFLVRNLQYSLLFLFSLFFGTGIVFFLKILFDVSRPADGIVPVFGQSFPSYHATIATIFFFMLMFIFDDHLSHRSRLVFNLLCILTLVLVSFSRLYLGAHWLSDVLFGMFLGTLISYFLIKFFKYRKNIHP